MFTNTSRPSAVDVLRPFTIGDIFTADTTSTLAKVADVAVGNVLLSGGVGVIPAWGKVTLSSHVSGVLPAINGGTGVANTGTITNSGNITFTGTGTIATGTFTLTVPATGTAALLGTANTFTQTNAFAAITATNITNSALTSGRVTIAGASGILSDTSEVTYSSPSFQVGANATVSPGMIVNGAAATLRLFILRTAGSNRWFFMAENTAESGGNAGSNFQIRALDDTGSTIDTPFAITRAAGGAMTIARPLTLSVTTGTTLTVSSTDTTAAASLAGGMTIATGKNVRHGTAAIATNATDGFIYAPTCAGTPTGTPTTLTGTAPIVIDTTNHKLYFYSGGSWRDAGP